MTPNAPTFKQVEEFLKIDGWAEITVGHGAKHRFFEKVLETGEVLGTHISHSGSKSPGPDRFRLICSEQLKITAQQFWTALQNHRPVPRPAPIEEQTPMPDAWQVNVLLHQVGLSPDELQGMTPQQAQKLIEQHWASPDDVR